MAWHYVLNGASHGPVTEADIHTLHAQNVIALDTPVWTEGMSGWVPFGRSALASGGVGAAPVAVSAGPAGATQVCAECGRTFPESEMLGYENAWVCAACKPLFFQRLREGVTVRGVLRYATVGRRFAAILLDGLITGVACTLPLVAISAILAARHPPGQKAAEFPGWFTALSIFLDFVPVIYEVFMIANYGATFGKMLMKIKVTRPDGARISYARSTGRYFAKILSGLIIYVGYLMAFWDDEKRAMHDRMCDTRVVMADAT